MTNEEKVISYLGFAPNSNAVESALQDAGLEVTAEFDNSVTGNVIAVKKAAIILMDLLFTTPDTTNENGYVIRYDRASMLRHRNKLAGEIGEELLGEPRITAPKVW